MREISPGVYDDDAGGLHICLPELLAAHGYPDTEQNRQTMLAAARELLGERAPDAELIVHEGAL